MANIIEKKYEISWEKKIYRSVIGDQHQSRYRLIVKVFPLLLFTYLIVGCQSFGLSPSAMINEYVENIMASIASQEDPELVRQGVPTLILFLDASLAKDPDNSALLRTVASAYISYAQAFVMSEEDEERATILYGRAMEYGLKLLERRKFFVRAVNSPLKEFEKMLKQFDKSDVSDLYITGNAWLGWILSQPNSMEAMAELPKALALMRRVLELDDGYAEGGAHMVFGIYYAVQPPGAGRDLGKSQKHFQRAMALAGDSNFLPKVTYVEFYATARGDEKLFDNTLQEVLESKKTKGNNRQHALINAIARERAKQLLGNKEDYF